MAKGDFKKILTSGKTWLLGWIVGTASYLLSMLSTAIGITKTIKIGNYVQVTGALIDVNVRQQLSSGGIAGKLGTKLLQLLTVVPKFELIDYLTVVIGSVALVIIGRTLYTQRWAVKISKKPKYKLFHELFYGALAVTLITTVINIMSVGVTNGLLIFSGLAIAMAIYYVIVSIVVLLLTMMFKQLDKVLNR